MNDVASIAAALRGGGAAAIPTETVYGLAAAADCPQAVARIFELKARPRFDPLIVHAVDIEMARACAADWGEAAAALADAFWPGPLTLVVPKAEDIPPIVTAGLETVALRVPAHPLALEVIRQTGRPLAAPSANPFGGISPTRAEHVRAAFGDQVPVLDGGPCAVGLESTIVSIVGPPVILRYGGTPREAVEAILGPVEARTSSDRPEAPGMLSRHYAPRTATALFLEGMDPPGEGETAVLRYRRAKFPPWCGIGRVLSPSGNPREAAANLFAQLHDLDALGLARILVESAPDEGLGRAINDRIRRACRTEE